MAAITPDRFSAVNFLFGFRNGFNQSLTKRSIVQDDQIVFVDREIPVSDSEREEEIKAVKNRLLSTFDEIYHGFDPHQPKELRFGATFVRKSMTKNLFEKTRRIFMTKVIDSVREEVDHDFRTKIREIDQALASQCLDKLLPKVEELHQRLRDCAAKSSSTIQTQIDNYQTKPASIKRLKNTLEKINQVLRELKEELEAIFERIAKIHKSVVPEEFEYTQNDDNETKAAINIYKFRHHFEGCEIEEVRKNRLLVLFSEINDEISKIYNSALYFSKELENCRSDNFEVADYRTTFDENETIEELYASYQISLLEGSTEVREICTLPQNLQELVPKGDVEVHLLSKRLYAIALLRRYQKEFVQFRKIHAPEMQNPKTTVEWQFAEGTLKPILEKEEYKSYFVAGPDRPKITIDSDLWMFRGLVLDKPDQLCELSPLIWKHDKVLFEIRKFFETQNQPFMGVVKSGFLDIYRKLAEIDLYILGLKMMPPLPQVSKI